jgi:hypothetical protein
MKRKHKIGTHAVGVRKRKQGSKQHNLPPKEKSQSNHGPQTLNQNERLGRSGGTRPRRAKRSATLANKPERSKRSISFVKPTIARKAEAAPARRTPCCSEERTQIEPNYGQTYHISNALLVE